MSYPAFPAALAKIQDSKYFGFTLEDKSIKGEVDGGYVLARPRHTRRPRRTFKTGFTDISQAEVDLLVEFFEEVGCYSKFTYIDPATGRDYLVRFNKPFNAKYTGMGSTRLYTVSDIELVEA